MLSSKPTLSQGVKRQSDPVFSAAHNAGDCFLLRIELIRRNRPLHSIMLRRITVTGCFADLKIMSPTFRVKGGNCRTVLIISGLFDARTFISNRILLVVYRNDKRAGIPLGLELPCGQVGFDKI